MCLGIPGRIINITGATAVIDVAGARKTVSMALLDDAAVGEYVIVHAGYAIEKIDAARAEETLRLIDEVAFKR